jgi:orotate phosphoribosyltransferase-like protein
MKMIRSFINFFSKLLAKGMPHKEIADLLELSVAALRRLMNGHPPEKTRQ